MQDLSTASIHLHVLSDDIYLENHLGCTAQNLVRSGRKRQKKEWTENYESACVFQVQFY